MDVFTRTGFTGTESDGEDVFYDCDEGFQTCLEEDPSPPSGPEGPQGKGVPQHGSGFR